MDIDVDLMVIGDVSLRNLAPALKRLELEIGRQVSVVIYSREDWEAKIDEQHPFVTRVRDSEKIFVKGNAEDLEARDRSTG